MGVDLRCCQHRMVGDVKTYSIRGMGTRRAPQIFDLLDFNDATFSRSTEAAAIDPSNGDAFYDLITPWPGVDVKRILPSGAILLEGARSNSVGTPRSITSSAFWTGNNTAGCDLSPDAANGPDGLAVADRVTKVAPGEQYSRFLPGAIAGTALRYSQYLRAVSGTSPYGIGVWAPPNQAAGTVSTAWTRIAVGPTTLAAPTPVWTGASGYPGGDFDVYIDLMQIEEGAVSSPIRGASRGADDCRFSAAAWENRIATGQWSMTIAPSHASGDVLSEVICSTSVGAEYLQFFDNVGTKQVWWVSGGNVGTRNATWSAGSELTFDFDWDARTCELSGFLTGNGTLTLPGSGTWDPAATLRLGAEFAGGSPFFGKVWPPTSV